MAESADTVRFVGSDRTCSTTAAFCFTRPEGYRFVAGQFMSLSIETREGPQTHLFSHCDAPDDDVAMILTRLTGSAFKDALLAMRPGDTATLRGPQGLLTVPPALPRAAFLVGGVGVSPARSIVRDAALRDSGVEALVFDGNLDETCVPFKNEFDRYEHEHPNIRFVHVLEKPSGSWRGERGFITTEVVRSHCDPLDGRHWFVAGPPAMVTAMRKVLDDLKVPASSATFELFAGYR
jgi:glycine betaine catabolism B